MAEITFAPGSFVPENDFSTVHVDTSNIVAGEAIDAGQVVCLLASDSKYYKADANNALKRNVKGFAGNSTAAAGQKIDIISRAPACTVGAHGEPLATPLYLAETPGKVCLYDDLTPGATPILVAYTVSSTEIEIVLAKASTALAA